MKMPMEGKGWREGEDRSVDSLPALVGWVSQQLWGQAKDGGLAHGPLFQSFAKDADRLDRIWAGKCLLFNVIVFVLI